MNRIPATHDFLLYELGNSVFSELYFELDWSLSNYLSSTFSPCHAILAEEYLCDI